MANAHRRQPPRPQPPRPWERVQHAVLFVVGIAGIGYETLVARADRPYLLAVFATMVGLPAFIGRDRRRDNDDDDAAS